MKEKKIEKRRENEKQVVRAMITLYCRRNHHDPGGGLCPECAALADYASARTAHCRRIPIKSYCHRCPHPCYKPAMQEQIKEVMKFSGPRIMLYYPVLATRHMYYLALGRHERKKMAKKPESSAK